MRPFAKSIAWRIQFWHFAILMFAVIGLSTAWFVQTRRAMLSEVDAELVGAARLLDVSLRGIRFEHVGRGGHVHLNPHDDHRINLPREMVDRRGTEPYFAIWLDDGRMLKSAPATPDSAEFDTELRDREPRVRQREEFREVHLKGPVGTQVLVGRDLTEELTQLHRLIAQICAIAFGILTVGLVGGWWLARSALRPITEMSHTAARFSAADMSPRIDVVETESELGELASMLNAAFDRVESAFDQQKQFAADASHELRTPLAVIQSQIELALRKGRAPEEYIRTLSTCEDASERLSVLIDALLTLARLDSGEQKMVKSAVRLDHVVAKCTDMMRPVAERAEVSLSTEIEPASVLGDAKQLEHAILNLLKNAIAYNRPGGTASLDVKVLDKETAQVSITDNGIGIAEEELPHVTKRFYRADKARSRHQGGSGLGLSIASQIIQFHGGTLNIDSTLGEGTSIVIRLDRVVEG